MRAWQRYQGGPRTPPIPRLLPPAPPPHLGKGLLGACLTPMESHKPMPGPLGPQGLNLASPLFICSALRKAVWPPQRNLAEASGPHSKPPAPPRALGCLQQCVALLRAWPSGWGLTCAFCRGSGICQCSINFHLPVVETVVMGGMVVGTGMG